MAAQDVDVLLEGALTQLDQHHHLAAVADIDLVTGLKLGAFLEQFVQIAISLFLSQVDDAADALTLCFAIGHEDLVILAESVGRGQLFRGVGLP